MEKDSFFKNDKVTDMLEYGLNQCDTFEEFVKIYTGDFLNDDTQIGDYLRELMNKYGKAASKVSKDAGLHISYVGNIINGKKNNPSRNALISICLAIGATFDEAQSLLKYAGQAPMYAKRKRDVVIWFGFMKGQNIDEVNETLFNQGYAMLTKDKK